MYVDKLSTGNVDKFLSVEFFTISEKFFRKASIWSDPRPIKTSSSSKTPLAYYYINLSLSIRGKSLWITFPQFLWITFLDMDVHVDSVDNFSTIFVDNSPSYIGIYRHLIDITQMWITFPQFLWIIQGDQRTLSRDVVSYIASNISYIARYITSTRNVDSVDKLSTRNVDNSECSIDFESEHRKLYCWLYGVIGGLSNFEKTMWIVWITFPQFLWIIQGDQRTLS